MTDQQLQISLNASSREYTLAFTAFTDKNEFPPISEQVFEALNPYDIKIEQKGETGKYVQILLNFSRESY